MKNILIAGCGKLGQAYAQQLSSHGARIYGLRRNIKSLPSEITGISADLSAPSTLTNLPNIDTLIYVVSADKRSPEAYRNAYFVGITNLLEQLRRQKIPVSRCIYISSTSVYQESNGGWVDESSDLISTSESATRWLVEGENVVRSQLEQHYILRYSGIYGPGRFHLIKQVCDGFMPSLASEHFTNRIHHQDCVASVMHMLNSNPPFGTYNVSDSHPASYYDVCQYIHAKLTSAGIKLAFSEPENIQRKAGSKRCSNKKLLDTGYQIIYPSYKEGYQGLILQWMAQQVLNS